jgi:tocopherol O-methyltransferase
MTRPNDKRKIVEHYETVSQYYKSLWGDHIHHGYWVRGDETKEQAQEHLIEHLAGLAGIRPGSRLLDIGCGFGGSSLFLSRTLGVSARGITISPVQVRMANEAAAREGLDAHFDLMDAEELHFDECFDVLWSVESISHYRDRQRFFRRAVPHLKAGGTFALTDWFRKPGLSDEQTRRFIRPIEQSMFVELDTMSDYQEYLEASGCRVVHREILNDHCARSWDIGLDIIKKKALWELALRLGADFVKNLKGFKALRDGFASGNFVYGLLVAKLRPSREDSGFESSSPLPLGR